MNQFSELNSCIYVIMSYTYIVWYVKCEYEANLLL